MMYTMPKNLLSICVNFALATQRLTGSFQFVKKVGIEPILSYRAAARVK